MFSFVSILLFQIGRKNASHERILEALHVGRRRGLHNGKLNALLLRVAEAFFELGAFLGRFARRCAARLCGSRFLCCFPLIRKIKRLKFKKKKKKKKKTTMVRIFRCKSLIMKDFLHMLA